MSAYNCRSTSRSATERRRVVPKRSESPVRRDWTCRTADNRGLTVTIRNSEFKKPHRGVVTPSWSTSEGSLMPAVATQPSGQFVLRSPATHGGASTLTYNWVQLTTLNRASRRTEISPALRRKFWTFQNFRTATAAIGTQWGSAAFTHGCVCALWQSTAFIHGFWTAAERRQKPPMCNSGLSVQLTILQHWFR